MPSSLAQRTTPCTRRRLAALVAAGLAAAACHVTHDPARDRTLVVALAVEPMLLLPPLITETSGFVVADQILERLADPDASLEIADDRHFHPRLADAWTWAVDSLALAFHLSPNAAWHDGRPVTAGDVRFTFDLYTDTALASPAAPLLTDIDSVEARDERTAVFWFRHRTSRQFFDATYHMRILPRHLLDTVRRDALRASAFARAPTGSGPFRFVQWRAGQTLELAANPRYDRQPPRFQRLVFAIVPEPSAALARALAGELDVLPNLRPADVTRVARSPGLRALRWPALSSGLVILAVRGDGTNDTPHPLFGDRRVRLALAHAIDRPRLAGAALGSAAVAARGPLPVALLRDSADLLPAFDPAHAAALLDSAGWRAARPGAVRQHGDRRLRFTLLIPSAPGARRVAVLVQSQLRRVGVAMDIEAADQATIVARLTERRFDAALLALDWDPDPLSARQLWGSDAIAGGANFSGYRNPAFDSAIAGAAATGDPAAARAFAARAWRALAADAPAIWLYDLQREAAVRSTVQVVTGRADAWWSALTDWSAAPPVRQPSAVEMAP